MSKQAWKYLQNEDKRVLGKSLRKEKIDLSLSELKIKNYEEEPFYAINSLIRDI